MRTPARVYGEQVLARVGVAAFAFSLVTPTAVGRMMPPPKSLVDARVASASAVEAIPAAPAFDHVLDAVLVPLEVRAVGGQTVVALTAVASASSTPVPVPAVSGVFVPVVASWYGPGFYGNRLPCWRWLEAQGQPIQFRAETWGVAHKTLPCGTTLVLRYGTNEVTVPVVDRGPYLAGRELDLSPRVRAALGCTDLCTVLMRSP